MPSRVVALISGLGLVLFLAAAAWLGRLERGGPPHVDLVLDGGIPATFYLPVGGSTPPPADAAGAGPRAARSRAEAVFLDPVPRDRRPPALVLLHGFGSDRRFTSSLARRLAGAGYAVLTPDLRGHGDNRNPFRPGWGRADSLYADVSAAVDFLRASPFVDGSRLALMGHSMGAGAALDYATRDSGIDAAVMIAGGWVALGPYRPPNALFIYAERDPMAIVERSRILSAALAGVEGFRVGEHYGEISKGTGVRAFEVPGTDHGSIVFSRVAVREILDWLGAVFGREPGADAGDPRLVAVGALLAALVLVLPGLGLLVARLAGPQPPLPDARRGLGLVVLAGALLASMPIFAVGSPGAVLSIEVGDGVFAHLGIAGIALLVLLVLTRAEWTPILRGWPRALAGAGVGLVGAYCLLHPLGAVVSDLSPTPERMAVFLASTGVLLPFSLAFQLLLRRGTPLAASAVAVAGRAIVLGVLGVGVFVEILSPVVLLMMPALAGVFVLVEILAGSVYAASRNLAAIALVDAAWLAFVVAVSMPVRI